MELSYPNPWVGVRGCIQNKGTYNREPNLLNSKEKINKHSLSNPGLILSNITSIIVIIMTGVIIEDCSNNLSHLPY